MLDDYAIATASPRPATIGGGTYLVGKFTPRDLGDLQAWIKSQVPDPRTLARELCRDLPDSVALEIWRDLSAEARLSWPPSIDTAEGNRLLLMTGEGAAYTLWVLLRRHNPGVDLERARALAEHVTPDGLGALLALAFPEPSFDPKSPRTPTTEMEPMEAEDRGPVPTG